VDFGGRRFAGTAQDKGAAAQQVAGLHTAWDAVNAMDGSWAIRRAISRSRSIAVSEHACNSMRPAPASPPPSANPRRPQTPTTACDGSLGPLTLASSSHLANQGPSAAHLARHDDTTTPTTPPRQQGDGQAPSPSPSPSPLPLPSPSLILPRLPPTPPYPPACACRDPLATSRLHRAGRRFLC
jgi:hypothetical protein